MGMVRAFCEIPRVKLATGMETGHGPLLSFPPGLAVCGKGAFAAEDGFFISLSPSSDAVGSRKSTLAFVARGNRLKSVLSPARLPAREVPVKAGEGIPEGCLVADHDPSPLWVVTTCMGRRKFAEKAVPSLARQPFVRHVLVDWSCPERTGRWARETLPGSIVVEVPGKETFRVTAARNVGASVVDPGAWILFADCDLVFPPDFVKMVVPLMKAGHYSRVAKAESCKMGTCLVNQRDWKSTGGYDELIAGYGGDDFDFYKALEFAGVKQGAGIPNVMAHIEHGDAARVLLLEEDGHGEVETRGWAKRRQMRLNRIYIDRKWDKAKKLGRFLTPGEKSVLRFEAMIEPKVSFCTTCRDRLWQKDAFLSNLELARSWDVEFVLVDYGSTDGLRTFVEGLPKELTGKLRYYRVEADMYRCPHAKNVAHVAATGDVLMNLDFDNYLNPDTLEAILDVVRDGRVLHDSDGPGGTFGRIIMTRRDFMALRGYDESFAPMRWQDNDILNRAKAAGMTIDNGPNRLPRRTIDNERITPQRMEWHAENVAKGKEHRRIVNPGGFGRASLESLDGSKRESGAGPLFVDGCDLEPPIIVPSYSPLAAPEVEPPSRIGPLLPDEAFEPVLEAARGIKWAYFRAPGNVGDDMIDEGTWQLFERNGIAMQEYRGTIPEWAEGLLISGGGNLGSAWDFSRERAAQYAQADARGLPIVILPQSVLPPVEPIPERATIFVREKASLAALGRGRLAPDMSLALMDEMELRRPVRPRGVFLRSDRESILRAPKGSDPASLAKNWREYVKIASENEEIVTDRLHFAIAGLLARRKVVLLRNSYHKNAGMWEAWLNPDALSSRPPWDPPEIEKVVMVLGLYRGQTPEREAELAEARRRNLANPRISEVRFVLEEEAARSTTELSHPKARLFELGRRATYTDLLRVANLASGKVVVCNADIWFDEDIARVSPRPGEMLSATYGAYGQDAWFLRAPFKDFACDQALGKGGCEFRLAWEARNAGLKVYKIQPKGMHHEHATGLRNHFPSARDKGLPLYEPLPYMP